MLFPLTLSVLLWLWTTQSLTSIVIVLIMLIILMVMTSMVCLMAGTCDCIRGYGGTDCSFKVSLAPTVASQASHALCQSDVAACNRTFVRGEHFMENVGELSCHLTPIEVCCHSGVWVFSVFGLLLIVDFCLLYISIVTFLAQINGTRTIESYILL